jgi:hypothetical protein
LICGKSVGKYLVYIGLGEIKKTPTPCPLPKGKG